MLDDWRHYSSVETNFLYSRLVVLMIQDARVCLWHTRSEVLFMPSKPGAARLRAFQGTPSDMNDALAPRRMVPRCVLRRLVKNAWKFPTSKLDTTGADRPLQTLRVAIWWGR